jgi:hypothetical protein
LVVDDFLRNRRLATHRIQRDDTSGNL